MAQPSRKAQFFTIFFTILLSTIGFGICIPVLPIYGEKYQASGLMNGLLTAIFSIMQFIVAPWWGRFSDKRGRRPAMIISVIGSTIGYLITGFAEKMGMMIGGSFSAVLVFVFIGRMIDGASGGNIAAAQACLADITTPEERSKAMGMIGAAFGLGFIMGPAFGGWLSAHHGSNAPFFAAAVLCLINLVLVIFKLPESLPAELRGQGRGLEPLRELWAHVNGSRFKTVLAAYFFTTMAFSIMTQVYALINLKRYGLDELHTGYIFAFIGFLGVLIQGGFIRRLLPKYGEGPLALMGVILLLIAFFGLPLSTSIAQVVFWSSLISIGNSFTQPTLNGLASKSADATWQGRALGVMQSCGALGRAAGPLLGGWLLSLDQSRANLSSYAHYGKTPLWTAAAVMAITLVIASTLRSIKEPTK